MKLCFDMDFAVYEAAAVGDNRSIVATHKPTGEVFKADTRTQLWGHYAKKTGGILEGLNSFMEPPKYLAEDFEVVDVLEPKDFSFCTMVLDTKIASICERLGTDNYYGYVGSGDVFRHDIATLKPYKGNRVDMLRPTWLSALKKYAVDKHSCKVVTGIEVDDRVTMDLYSAHQKWKKSDKHSDKLVGIEIDKDAKGTTGWHYNPSKDTEPRLVEGFGSLWLDAKGKLDGCGRQWLLAQVLMGDISDNYSPTEFSDLKYGEKAVYRDLAPCKTDAEAWKVVVDVFKKMYPEPKTITNFRGHTFEISWYYVLNEMVQLAHMQRWENDSINVQAVLDKLNIT